MYVYLPLCASMIIVNFMNLKTIHPYLPLSLSLSLSLSLYIYIYIVCVYTWMVYIHIYMLSLQKVLYQPFYSFTYRYIGEDYCVAPLISTLNTSTERYISTSFSHLICMGVHTHIYFLHVYHGRYIHVEDMMINLIPAWYSDTNKGTKPYVLLLYLGSDLTHVNSHWVSN